MVRNLTKNDTEKTELLNGFFVSFIAAETGFWDAQAPDRKGKVWNKEDLPSVEKDQPREHLNKLNTYNSVRPDRLHPQVLRELADTIAKVFLTIFERLEQLVEVSEIWKRINVIPILK